MNQVVAFKGNLPSLNISHFQKALANTKQAVGVEAGGKQFLKLVKNGGYWVYGQKETEVEEGSRWAINPMSLQTGFIAWKGGQPVGNKMGSIFNPPITRDQLPEVNAKWDEAVSFDLVCVSGEDVGVQCAYNANSYGGRKAFTDLMDALMKQSGIDADKIVPIVEMESDSYEHKEYGTTYNPIFNIVDWGSMSKGAEGGEGGDDDDQKGTSTGGGDQPQKAAETPQPAQRQRRRAAGAPAEPTKAAETPAPERRQRRRAAG